MRPLELTQPMCMIIARPSQCIAEVRVRMKFFFFLVKFRMKSLSLPLTCVNCGSQCSNHEKHKWPVRPELVEGTLLLNSGATLQDSWQGRGLQELQGLIESFYLQYDESNETVSFCSKTLPIITLKLKGSLTEFDCNGGRKLGRHRLEDSWLTWEVSRRCFDEKFFVIWI